MAENDKAFFSSSIECHEHENASLLLHAPQFTATITSDPTFTVHRDVHLCAVVPARNIGNGHCAAQLLQQPSNVLFAAFPLLVRAGNERIASNKLEDGARCNSKLLLCGGLLTNDIAQFILFDANAVCIESPGVSDLLTKAFREGARSLSLDLIHAFQLSPTAATLITKDNELLAPALSTSLVTILRHEKHERAPFFFQAAKCGTAVACDIPNAIAWDFHNCAIITVLPTVHVHGALKLAKEPPHVLFSTAPLLASSGEECYMSHILHDRLRSTFKLLPCAALLTQSIRELIVLEGHGVSAPSARRIHAFVTFHNILPDLVEIAW
mmetsp:Transcript_135837/g.270963  ORF Transcript_135837/g.270963 Transcript_135837/m.270963 type:complete len:325 (+) Transcript_135837:580-1554(+)